MFGWTMLSVVLYTLIACLFKVAATRTQPKFVMTVAMFVVTVFSVGGMLVSNESLGSWQAALIAAAAGVFFYCSSIYQLRALQTAPTSLVSAITSLNLVIAGAIVLLLPLFDKHLAVNHVMALLVAAFAIVIGIRPEDMGRVSAPVLISLGLLALCSIAYSYYAQTNQPIFFYMAVNHFVAVLINARHLKAVSKPDIKWGALLGLCMFVAFWALLSALSLSGADAPLVLIALNLKTPLTALLAVPLFNERLSGKKALAVGLATSALILWRI